MEVGGGGGECGVSLRGHRCDTKPQVLKVYLLRVKKDNVPLAVKISVGSSEKSMSLLKANFLYKIRREISCNLIIYCHL